MRIDKYLSGQTGMSRRDIKDAAAAGRVRVNGAAVRDTALYIDEARDSIELDGRAIGFKRHTHIMLNKPAGVLTATEDRNAQTVLDLLPDDIRRRGVTPVGRLDKDTTGLLILTTDGQLAHRLISPRHHVEKEYIARVDGALDEGDVAAFAAGMELSDFTALPARLSIDAPDTARVVLTEGKYHQVKRMLAARGKPVIALKRVRMGLIVLDEALTPGKWRELTNVETEGLYRAAGIADED